MGRLRTTMGRELKKARRAAQRDAEFETQLGTLVEKLQETGLSEEEAFDRLERAGVIERAPQSPFEPIDDHMKACSDCRSHKKQLAMDIAGYDVDLASHEEGCDACRQWRSYSSDVPCDVAHAMTKDMNDRLRASLCSEGQTLLEDAFSSVPS